MTRTRFILCIVAIASITHTAAQQTDPLEHTILSLDSTFWSSYNSCDVESMKNFFTEDLEFYHDKGGMTKGLVDFISNTRNNLCNNSNFRLRREAVAGTVKVYVLKKDNKPYGAILSGQHVFYIIKDGKSPRADGLAKFTNLFINTESGWKISRVLSYDHGPAPYLNQRKMVTLRKSDLNEHVGQYLAPNAGPCVITRADNSLKLVIGDKSYTLLPESRSLFFQQDRDLTFEFTNNKMIVREYGEVVEEAVRSK